MVACRVSFSKDFFERRLLCLSRSAFTSFRAFTASARLMFKRGGVARIEESSVKFGGFVFVLLC